MNRNKDSTRSIRRRQRKRKRGKRNQKETSSEVGKEVEVMTDHIETEIEKTRTRG